MTLDENRLPQETHLDAVTTSISQIEALELGKTLIHVIGREGDSVSHLRQLSSQGFRWLIRGKEGLRVEYQGETQKLGQVAESLFFHVTRQVDYKGRKTSLAVSEAQITITRAAKPKRINEETGKKLKVQSGSLLRVRLIVTRLKDEELTRLAASVLDQFGDV